MRPALLIVEDDHALNQMLELHFDELGFAVTAAHDCAEARAALDRDPFDLILLDQQLPDGQGVELLTRIRARDPEQAVVMMTGQHDLELAITAIRRGAADFIHKPVRTAELELIVDRVLEQRRLSREVEALQPDQERIARQGQLLGRSAAMLQVSKEIALSAESSATVLIGGESGTGKEVVARLIHHHSGRKGPFIAVNCAAIVDTLLESELFGHEKGAFTGAEGRKPGKFELARDGTLFLDEVGELALPLQAKLLRALQERVIERVGGTQPVAVDARVISATHRDLTAEVAAGRFREDLYYRLKVVAIELPPLRDRPEDIPLLVEGLIQRLAAQIGRPPLKVAAGAMRLLQQRAWPGNVRELENALTQALVHARGPLLTPELLPPATGEPAAITGNSDTGAVERSLDEVEAEHIQRVLDHTGGHKGNSCAILGISRPALDRKIRKYGLRVGDD